MKPITLFRIVLFAAALTPAAALAYGFSRFYFAGDFNALTANPGDYITDQTGTWALGCLAASLSVTPIRRLTGWNEIIKARRMLGLFAFFYATLHMLTSLESFLWLRQSYGLSLRQTRDTLAELARTLLR